MEGPLLCDEDQTAIATLFCSRCAARFCLECDARLHGGRILSQHIRTPIIVTELVGRDMSILAPPPNVEPSGDTAGPSPSSTTKGLAPGLPNAPSILDDDNVKPHVPVIDLDSADSLDDAYFAQIVLPGSLPACTSEAAVQGHQPNVMDCALDIAAQQVVKPRDPSAAVPITSESFTLSEAEALVEDIDDDDFSDDCGPADLDELRPAEDMGETPMWGSMLTCDDDGSTKGGYPSMTNGAHDRTPVHVADEREAAPTFHVTPLTMSATQLRGMGALGAEATTIADSSALGASSDPQDPQRPGVVMGSTLALSPLARAEAVVNPEFARILATWSVHPDQNGSMSVSDEGFCRSRPSY